MATAAQRDQARARGLEKGIRSQDGILQTTGQFRSISLKKTVGLYNTAWKYTGKPEGRGSREFTWGEEKKYDVDYKGGMIKEGMGGRMDG